MANAAFIRATPIGEAFCDNRASMMRNWPDQVGKARPRACGAAWGPSGVGTWFLAVAFLGTVSQVSSGLMTFGLAPAARAQSTDSASATPRGPIAAQSRDPVVTSDSPEYCGILMERISELTRTTAIPPPSDASELSEEGERMCVHGQTRGGILRLRRALAILKNGED
jgi:hypothetical protein